MQIHTHTGLLFSGHGVTRRHGEARVRTKPSRPKNHRPHQERAGRPPHTVHVCVCVYACVCVCVRVFI